MTPIQAAQAVIGVVLATTGLALVVAGRRRLSRKSGAVRGAWWRVGVGFALTGLGYHLVAWVLPASWTPLKVGVDRWWIVAAIVLVVALGSVLRESHDSRLSS